MTHKTELSDLYIEGIKEGRDTLKHFPDLCPLNEYHGCKRLIKGASYEMKQFYKGQADFWHNQVTARV